MELHSESVQVANVERSKVMVEGIVEERVVDREVDGRSSRGSNRSRTLLCCTTGLLVGGTLRLGRVGERRALVGSMCIRC